MSSSVQQVLQLLVGPLRYGARDGFAHVGTLHGYREAHQLLDARRDGRGQSAPVPLKGATTLL